MSPVSVKFIQLDGDAVDVAQVLATAMGVQPALAAPVQQNAPALDEPEAEHVYAEAVEVAEDAPECAEEACADDIDEASAEVVPFKRVPKSRGEKLAERTMQGVIVPEGRYRDWWDVPEELQRFEATGFKCHVLRVPGDRLDVWCGNPPTMARLKDLEPRAAAEVCGSCNVEIVRHLERARTA